MVLWGGVIRLEKGVERVVIIIVVVVVVVWEREEGKGRGREMEWGGIRFDCEPNKKASKTSKKKNK